tara:strand:- start:513 stop:1139 length:627 start_codon:yes stop_codon:yes gene_type:complete
MNKNKLIIIILIILIIVASYLTIDYIKYKTSPKCLETNNPTQEDIKEHLNYLEQKKEYKPLINKLLKNPFKKNVKDIVTEIKDELSRASFSMDEKLKIHLSSNIIELDRGNNCEVIFSVKNVNKNFSEFTYSITHMSDDCKNGELESLSYIETPIKNSMVIPFNEEKYQVIKLNIPKEAQPCLFRYNIKIESDNKPYTTGPFHLKING